MTSTPSSLLEGTRKPEGCFAEHEVDYCVAGAGFQDRERQLMYVVIYNVSAPMVLLKPKALCAVRVNVSTAHRISCAKFRKFVSYISIGCVQTTNNKIKMMHCYHFVFARLSTQISVLAKLKKGKKALRAANKQRH